MKRDLLLAIAIILIVAGVCFGLATLRPDRPPRPSRPFSAASTGTTPATGEKVVMRVNGEAVTEREFSAIIRQSPEQMQSMYATASGRRALADQLVKLKALQQEARKLGASEDPEIRTQLNLDQANLMANYALRKIVGTPTDTELQAEYAKNKNKMTAPTLSGGLIPATRGRTRPGR